MQLCLSRRKVKDRDCHEIWAKLRGSSCLCAALLAVAACGCLLRQGWLLAAGYAMDALLAYAMYRKSRGLHFLCCPATEALLLRIEHFAAFVLDFATIRKRN